MIGNVDWGSLAAGATVATFVLGIHAWLMKIVISSEVYKLLNAIQKEYVTKEEFNRHVDTCPVKKELKP